jgi:hypothetical protein
MQIRATVSPGQRGTKKLLTQYGDRLVCVRYRYDKQRKKRFKTVELIIEEDNWETSETHLAAHCIVQLRVPWTETEVRQRVKVAGGRWDPVSRLWALRYERVVALGLAGRIVRGEKLGLEPGKSF